MVFGQAVVDSTALTLPEILDGLKNIESIPQAFIYELAISTLLMNIVGYLSPVIPFFNKIPSTAWRIVAFIVVAVAILINVGVDLNVVTQIVAYFFSTGLYNLVLKLFVKKTSKPEEGLQGVLSLKR